MPWPSDGAVEKASTAGPNNAAGIFLPITDYRAAGAARPRDSGRKITKKNRKTESVPNKNLYMNLSPADTSRVCVSSPAG